MRLQASKTF